MFKFENLNIWILSCPNNGLMTKILHLKDRIIDLFTTSIFKMTNSDIINDECSGFSFHKIIKKKPRGP